MSYAAAKPHLVFWGSHGCRYTKGHAHPCRCVCGDVYQGTHVYGDNATTAVSKPSRDYGRVTWGK